MLTIATMLRDIPRLEAPQAELILRLFAARDDVDRLVSLVQDVPRTAQYARNLHSDPYSSRMWRRILVLHAADVLLETAGVESVEGTPYEYCNTGDSYATTLIYNSETDQLSLGSWADIIAARESCSA